MSKNNQQGTALITGASSGIGEVFARKLAERGNDLILTARRKDRLEKIAEQLRNDFSIDVDLIVADLSESDGIEIVAEGIRNCDKLIMLVNNAGFGSAGDFADSDLVDQMAMNSVMMLATIKLSHAALKGMLKRERGDIINVSSVSGFLYGAGAVTYCSIKSYVNTFSLSLQKEVKDKGLRIQALCPGFTYTEFHDSPKIGKFERSMIPKWMWLKAEKVVDDSLKALNKNKTICIPGLQYKIMVTLLRNRVIGPILLKFAKRV